MLKQTKAFNNLVEEKSLILSKEPSIFRNKEGPRAELKNNVLDQYSFSIPQAIHRTPFCLSIFFLHFNFLTSPVSNIKKGFYTGFLLVPFKAVIASSKHFSKLL